LLDKSHRVGLGGEQLGAPLGRLDLDDRLQALRESSSWPKRSISSMPSIDRKSGRALGVAPMSLAASRTMF
jgi:hypothetical protein